MNNMNDEEQEKQEGEVEEVEKEVETDKVKATEYLAGWKRALADYDNIKKDLGRERSNMRVSAITDAAMRVIPVLDNLDTAMCHAPVIDDSATKAWIVGIGFIKNQLEEVVGEMGVEPYGAVGDAFDANLHDAVGERESDEFPLLTKEGSGVVVQRIVEIVARGWKLGSKVIRPAKVIIAK